MKKLFLFFLILIIYSFNVYSQNPPCYPAYQGVTYKYLSLDHTPPLSTGMPLEVLIGYIAQDSLCRYAYPPDLDNWLNSQTNNDTINYIMKYYYMTMDYDPILYLMSEMYGSRYLMTPFKTKSKLDYQIRRTHPDDMVTYILCKSSIIAHIQVTNIEPRVETDSGFPDSLYIISGTILDTIKGKVLPTCYDISIDTVPHNVHSRKSKNKLLTEELNCFKFEYSNHWNRGGSNGPKLVDSLGNPWIKLGDEYVVFLETEAICMDSIYNYFSLYPTMNSWMFSMYPIIEGEVKDPKNEFKWGLSVPISLFKQNLRNRIAEIINY